MSADIVPSPKKRVFIVGLSKCGTTSFHTLFCNLGYNPAHYRISPTQSIASCMLENKERELPLMTGELSRFNALSDIGFVNLLGCNVQRMDILEQLIYENQDAQYILNTRDLDAHIRSIIKWKNFASGLSKLGHFDYEQNDDTMNVYEIGKWILTYNQCVRRIFTSKYPHVSFLEVAIDSEDVSTKLKAFLQCECDDVEFPALNSSNHTHTFISYEEARARYEN